MSSFFRKPLGEGNSPEGNLLFSEVEKLAYFNSLAEVIVFEVCLRRLGPPLTFAFLWDGGSEKTLT